MRRVLAASLAAALAAAGCGGADEREPTLRLADGGGPGTAVREPGETVMRFVQAARSGNARHLWNLLSEPTRASVGPTYERFARDTAPKLTEDFEDFGGFRVLMSRSLGGGWGVGAVVGRYTPEDGDPEPAAYAAALRREGDAWRVELAGVVVARLEPDPLAETDARPLLQAEAQAGGDVGRMLMWLDGRQVSADPSVATPFTAEIRGYPRDELPDGEHALVVFAATEDTAGALAWPFEVVG